MKEVPNCPTSSSGEGEEQRLKWKLIEVRICHIFVCWRLCSRSDFEIVNLSARHCSNLYWEFWITTRCYWLICNAWNHMNSDLSSVHPSHVALCFHCVLFERRQFLGMLFLFNSCCTCSLLSVSCPHNMHTACSVMAVVISFQVFWLSVCVNYVARSCASCNCGTAVNEPCFFALSEFGLDFQLY
jgi:hypothetical protein